MKRFGMRLSNFLTITILACVSACSPISPYMPSEKPPMVYEGQYVVEARAGAEWCQGVPADVKAECQTEHNGRAYLVSPIGDGLSVIRKEAISVLGGARIVPYKKSEDLCFTDFVGQLCDPNWHFKVDTTPNDPLFPTQWGLENIKALEAWETVSTSNVPVAVLDTGVDCSHPDINCIGEYNAITGEEGSGRALDRNGHGTHCASVIGSYCNNDEGVCGVGSGMPILACKFLGDNGGGSLSDAIRCLIWAREKGAKVVNASWGCQRCFSNSLLSQIRKSRDAGLLVFAAAAGNNGVDNDDIPHYPSDYDLSNDGYDPIISVAAIDQAERRASFSNYGSKSVDVAAPGVSVMGAYPGGDYKALSGTSMAAPHIAGASALLLGMGRTNPRQSILQSTRPLSNGNGGTVTNGTLDLVGAITGTPGEIPTPCQRRKLKKCREDCADKFLCKYAKQRRCRIACKEKWCPNP